MLSVVREPAAHQGTKKEMRNHRPDQPKKRGKENQTVIE